MKTGPSRGSHLPVLMTLLARTTGPVAELGCGMYSTPYLHWACFLMQRPLVTLEGKPEWHGFLRPFASPLHEVVCLTDWDAPEVSAVLARPWAVAFVDHSPSDRRWRDALRVAHAEYVVCHDAENSQTRKYGYWRLRHRFPFREKYTAAGLPYTAIYSHVHDVRGLMG